MTTPYADLHCHSTCSDGSLTPIELIDLAIEKGLKGLSITDHDTTRAYATALPYAKEKNVEIISGVEFSAFLGKESVHILGYSYQIGNEKIGKLCRFHTQRRQERNKGMLERLARVGIQIDESDLLKMNHGNEDLFDPESSIGRPHIAHAMIAKGYVSSVNEAFKKYLGEGKSCYVEGGGVTVEETIEAIREAGGLAVIAHPHLIKDKNLLSRLLEIDFDGMEVYYANIPSSQEQQWIKIAEKKGWIMTGGSDFHGISKPTIQLASSWVDASTFKFLHQHFLDNQTNDA